MNGRAVAGKLPAIIYKTYLPPCLLLLYKKIFFCGQESVNVDFLINWLLLLFFLTSMRTLYVNRDLKIPRFRVQVRVGLLVPVLGHTGNQSNLRYTG